MKKYATLLLSLTAVTAFAQKDSTAHLTRFTTKAYEVHSVLLSASLGFIDNYRQDFHIPAGFSDNNTSGYTNISVKIEYGLTRNVSIAANAGYDAFVYNFSQLYTGNGATFTRYRNCNFREFHLGVIAYYHFTGLFNNPRLDPFIGIGPNLSNQRFNKYPQGDSTLIKIDHAVTLYVKAGVRYYLSDHFSLFGDVGYEKQSIFSLGFSGRLFSRKK